MGTCSEEYSIIAYYVNLCGGLCVALAPGKGRGGILTLLLVL
jgi:hypothetical protein